MRAFMKLLAPIMACAAVSTVAHAQGLQVSPVSVTIEDRSNLLRLSNGSDSPLNAQVRVFRWSQESGEDDLTETEEVIASPPFVEVAPGGQQVIRLVRFGDPAIHMAECERAYRVIVDELPRATPQQELGLQYVLRYSVPVYLANPDCDNAEPALSWEIETDGEDAWLNVVNSGLIRAQLARITYIAPDGQRTPINGGLLGYVLADSHRRFGLPHPAATFSPGGLLEVEVNGTQRQETVAVTPSRL